GEVVVGHPAPHRLTGRLAAAAGPVGVQVAVEAALVQHAVGDRGAAFAARVAAEVGGEQGAHAADVAGAEGLLGGVGVEVTRGLAELRPLAGGGCRAGGGRR